MLNIERQLDAMTPEQAYWYDRTFPTHAEDSRRDSPVFTATDPLDVLKTIQRCVATDTGNSEIELIPAIKEYLGVQTQQEAVESPIEIIESSNGDEDRGGMIILKLLRRVRRFI